MVVVVCPGGDCSLYNRPKVYTGGLYTHSVSMALNGQFKSVRNFLTSRQFRVFPRTKVIADCSVFITGHVAISSLIFPIS